MEEHFEIGTERGAIRGMWHHPTTVSLGTVVLVHGYFSASRVGPTRLFVGLARELCKAGVEVIRADVLGVGDSDGDFASVTFQTTMRDVQCVIQFALDQSVDGKVALVGHSMGANIALCSAAQARSSRISGIVAIAPDVDVLGGVDRLFDQGQQEELRTRGHTMRKGLHINATFVDAIRERQAEDLTSGLMMPIVVIQGTDDELYEMSGAERIARAARRGRLIQIPDADHNFLALHTRAVLFSAVASAVTGCLSSDV